MLDGAICLVIDGLDEVTSMTVGGGVDAVLSQLSSLGHPRFILSSRQADWHGATARIKIEDDYSQPATLLHLQPFDRDDAERFLRANFPDLDPIELLDHLAERGLDDIYKNPLTLRLIGEVGSGSEPLPSSRAQLLERACTVMLREENARHHDAAHAQLSVDQLLLATGAHAAVQLLCDFNGIYTGAIASLPEGFVHADEVGALPQAVGAHAVLRTRLFRAEGEHRFQLVHRLIAEFLGARWLAACFEAGVPDRRILGLLGSGGGVPTSLRGIHAWLAHFSDSLAPRCIAADPYAVLRYGDADTMPVTQARLLLSALKQLSTTDPYFRAEDWGRHPAAALMKLELKHPILDIIRNPGEHTHLTFLLMEAMETSPLAAELAPELTEIMFDRARYFGHRSRAADALRSMDAIDNWPALIERLLVMADEDSRRLAWEQLHDVGLGTVPMPLVAQTLLAHTGLSVTTTDPDEDRLDFAHISDKSIDALSLVQLGELLDALRAAAEPLLEHASHSAKQQVADVARTAALRALTLDPTIPAAKIWHWLGWLPRNEGYWREAQTALYHWFAEHDPIRRAIQAHVMFDAGHEHVRDAMFAVNYSGPTLPFSSADLAVLLKVAQARAKPALVEIGLLEELALLDRGQSGISAEVYAVAARLGSHDPAFLAKLEEWTKPIVYDWQRDEDELRAKYAKRQSIYQQVRDRHIAQAADVAAGQPQILYEPAKVYLGRYSEFRRLAPPQARVVTFLGETLGEETLQGFMASLIRDDLPSAQAIAESHVADKHWFVEVVLVCGIAERIRRGIALDDIPADSARSAFMSWRRCAESNIVGGVEIGNPLEALVLTDEVATERFFRTSIEPQLAARSAHVQDLYYLANDARWSALAGRLAIEWIERFPILPETLEAELLNCASRHGARDAVRAFSIASRTRVHRDYRMMLAWLSLDFLVDFADRETDLAAAADEDREFLWFIRNRVAREREDPEPRLSIAQRAFVIERFSHVWPRAGRPSGSSSGDTNPWDATEFIERMGYGLGGDPSPQATAALERLIGIAHLSYTDALRHALALQRRGRRDYEYSPATLGQLRAIVENGLPESIDDMRAYFASRILDLDTRMRGSNTDMWQAYWAGGSPRGENFCRNRLVEHISGQLPQAIRFEPEMHMPGQKRADIAAIRNRIGLPVEIKGQWHPEVWTAPTEQLAARYTRDWHAEGRGAYIVLWFGDVPRKNLPAHPDGLPTPKTPDELRAMLVDRLPESLWDVIDVYVIDVSPL
ncbi:MAG: hypothetical protein E5Y70_17530 [Mesorhizobium sp.]|uniref:hypothetical protein n=1 Tax=Mesorhizobium sp. TaxID=1871066 RepID=UPI001203F502|nr:hypothetical protein [Mesorhizobium sp.]TIL73167.1 MAG: hypothetical protein E5Y70_17530 [Mesorhizobium sp.]